MIPEQLLQIAQAKGTDEEYQDYVRQFPCVFTQLFDRVHNGVGRSVYAHVNRVDRGSGMALKTLYSGVPTINEVHTVLMHGKGETPNLREFLDEASNQMLANWINGKKPIEYEIYKKDTKRTYEINFPEMLDAVVLGIKRRWVDGKARLARIVVSNAKKRTLKQNNAQWLLYQQIDEFIEKDPMILSRMLFDYSMKMAKMTASQARINAIHEILKVLILEGRSTTELETDTWGDLYAQDILHYAKETHGIDLVMPVKPDGREYNNLNKGD